MVVEIERAVMVWGGKVKENDVSVMRNHLRVVKG